MPSTPSSSPPPADRANELLAQLGYRLRPYAAEAIWRELRAQAARSGLTEQALLLSLLREPPGSERRLALGEAISVYESSFFRHPAHFELLEGEIAPALCAARGGRGLTVLSAGCANGEELYSLAIACERAAPGREHRYHGFDISRAALAAARRGRYREWAFRGSDPGPLAPWVVPAGGGEWGIDGKLLTRTQLFHGTLGEPPPALEQAGPFDVVFCRNVLIYFTAEAGREAAGRLARLLAPDGFLFVGPADHDHCADLAWERRGMTYVYRKTPARRFAPSPAAAPEELLWSVPAAAAPAVSPVSPASAPEPRSKVAQYEALLEKGRAALDASALTDAFAAFDQSIQLLPERPEAYFEQAVLLSEHRQGTAASELLERALYLDACFTPASVLLARLHLLRGQAERAGRLLARVVSTLEILDPREPVPSWGGLTVAELRRTCQQLLERTGLRA